MSDETPSRYAATMKAIASGNLILNAVKCNTCKIVVWSVSVHDFRECACGGIAVDGGLEYLRRVGDGSFTELSIYLDEANRGRQATTW